MLLGISLFATTHEETPFPFPIEQSSNNQLPIAINDDNITLEGEPVTGQVVTNDFDPDGTVTLIPMLISMPNYGNLVMYHDGTYTYTPNPGFVGKDQFNYMTCLNSIPALCSEAQVNIAVLSKQDNRQINDPPVANNDEIITYNNTPVNIEVLSNDYDRESTALRVNLMTQPANGTTSINALGQYTYNPNSSYTGADHFTYQVCDSGLFPACDTATVYIQIVPGNYTNKPPFAGDDFTVTSMDSPISKNAFTNDYDLNADPFVITKVNNTNVSSSGATVLTMNGSVTISPGGSYTYTPKTAFTGTDQFIYQICDITGHCSWATVYLVILEETCINLQLKVNLEGAMSDKNGNYLSSMRTDLNTGRSILPGQIPINPLVPPTPPGQPYNYFPFNYTGSVSENAFSGPYDPDVVDWILVSLRSDIMPASEFKRVAGLVYKDGTVLFIENSIVTSKDPNQIYVVIEHRNHLGMMTPGPIKLTDNNLFWDFTTQNSYTGGGNGQKRITQGVWAMIAGDCDQTTDSPSYDINGFDYILWRNNNGFFDRYTSADINMDGDCANADKLIRNNNNGISSAVQR